MQRTLIVIGAVLVVADYSPWFSAGAWPASGDIRVESESGGFYFPMSMTCVVISIVMSVLIWTFRICCVLARRPAVSRWVSTLVRSLTTTRVLDADRRRKP